MLTNCFLINQPVCLLTSVQREVEAGWSVADVGVGGGVNSQQEAGDQLQQLHVWRGPQHLLDDSDKRQAHLLRDGRQVFVPMLLETKETQLVSEEATCCFITLKVLKYLQNLAGEQEAVHDFSFEELTDVEDLMRVVDPD